MVKYKGLPRCQGTLQTFHSKITFFAPQNSPEPQSVHCAHTPLQRVEDGGLHDVVPGGKLVQTFLLHLGIILSSGIIFLLLQRQGPERCALAWVPCHLAIKTGNHTRDFI